MSSVGFFQHNEFGTRKVRCTVWHGIESSGIKRCISHDLRVFTKHSDRYSISTLMLQDIFTCYLPRQSTFSKPSAINS